MITKEQVIPLLLVACPSFQQTWDEFAKKELFYPALGEFAGHLLQLQLFKQTESFQVIGNVIERLHVEGDANVTEAATIELLEGIQNVWGHSTVEPDLFKEYLLPTSLKWWDELNAFWQGERRYVGEGVANDLSLEEVAKIREEVRNRFKTEGGCK